MADVHGDKDLVKLSPVVLPRETWRKIQAAAAEAGQTAEDYLAAWVTKRLTADQRMGLDDWLSDKDKVRRKP